jgi:signal transduction histidine kinase
MGVRDHLTQVVLNLVLNAVDATDNEGHINVAATVDDDWLVLTVADDGRGISIADRCRLFQPFFTTKAHGTGLGLFISRQILDDHAGTLSCRSDQGAGSTFFVRLPLQPACVGEPEIDQSDRSRAAEPLALVTAAAIAGDEPR